MSTKHRAICLLALSLALPACRNSRPALEQAPEPAAAASAESATARYADVLISDVPHVRQKPDFCGEACAEMMLRKLGFQVDQDRVFEQTGVHPVLGRGAYTAELRQGLVRLGFDVGKVWHQVNVASADTRLEALFRELHADLTRGVPSIVCTRFDESPQTTEHFRLILGYDAKTDEVIYHDPAVDKGAHLRMPRARLLSLWPLQYNEKVWTVVRLRLDPAHVAASKFPASSGSISRADLAQHVMALRKRLPSKDFHIVLEPPFVVVGDEPPKRVQERAAGTVRWASRMLKQEFFSRNPSSTIDVWLFKDKPSYEKHTRQLFGTAPSTPYGWYASSDRALIMNIRTGGGTLVHEMVHAFMESNFPNAPPWFNEGLGSLYEQCGEENGRIHGYTNWRLPGLQKAIHGRRVPSFEKLLSMDTHAFYDLDEGTNYSQARYLCYYLQQKGLLRRYYREFLAAHRNDPTGVGTLRSVLGESDLRAFKGRWEKYVLGLRFR